MKTVGIALNINLSKLDKKRFVTGKNGTYADLTVFVDLLELDQYGNSGGIRMALKKDESKDTKMDFVGNAKVFWSDEGKPMQQQSAPSSSSTIEEMDDDIPF
jgi:hypothetical protein